MTIDTHVCFVFKRDHTFTISFDGEEPFPGGSWHIQGSEIIIDGNPKLPFSEGSPPQRFTNRVRFVTLPSGELQLDGGHWKREK